MNSPEVLPSGEVLAELYRQHSRELRLFLVGLLRDRADAEDALQQTFLELLRSWERVEPEKAKAWLYKAAYHAAMALHRRRGIDSRARAKLLERPVWQSSSSEAAEPSREAVRSEAAAAVRNALERLPESQRLVVQARMDSGQTFAEIAREHGCPLGTVLTRMRLALKTLRGYLKEW